MNQVSPTTAPDTAASVTLRRLTDYLGHCLDRGYVALGPLVITTTERHQAMDRNAFEIGRQAERYGLKRRRHVSDRDA